MPQSERVRVWKGELKKTSGGLTKKDLIKNKRGRIVSKKKSEAAKKNSDNNLGAWLRSKGDPFLSKGLKAENIIRKNKPGRKAFKKEDEVPEEKQSEVKSTQKPKKTVIAKKKKPTLRLRLKPKAPKPTLKKVRPTMVGDKPDNRASIDVGNIRRGRRKRTNRTSAAETYAKQVQELLAMEYTKKEIIKELGQPPAAFSW